MNRLLMVVLVAFGLSVPAHAWLEGGGERDEALTLEPDLENGIEVYEVCAGCHLPEGWGRAEGTFPQLSGQHKEVLITAHGNSLRAITKYLKNLRRCPTGTLFLF